MIKPQIAVLDFGSQYTHLITRRIRQLGVLVEIHPPTVSPSLLLGVKGLILSGGPASVYDKTAISYNRRLFNLGVPILGLCYGHQLLAHHFGGQVLPSKTKEYGYAELKRCGQSQILRGVKNNSRVWMSHGDSVLAVPSGFLAVAQTADCPIAAMANDQRRLYGLQFHPEVAHSDAGLQVLKNFVFTVCRCRKDWSPDRYWRQIILDVKRRIGRRNVFLLVSGGVDSAVCFALLEKVLGKKRVFGLHIDNGFIRLDESRQVAGALAQAGFEDLYLYDASRVFLKALSGVADPEKKREIIGRMFLKIKDQVMAELKLDIKKWVLGQGTIYPDTIETGGTKHADKIKTHHNRVKEILKLMRLGSLIEPISELYKDEVRAIGRKLGLPNTLLNRHPFPGPGLAIRVLCSSGREKIEKLEQINRDLQRAAGKDFRVTMLPVRSVGVQGDNRTYRHPALITGELNWEKLHHTSVRLTNEVRAINRVVYACFPKQLARRNFRLKASALTKDRLDLLRQVDNIVTQEIKAAGLYQKIWQFPVVLSPLTLHGGETIILRPVESKEAMTVNFYPMPKNVLNRLVKEIVATPGIDAVLYDITNKPPGTIEWE
ncbi:MAG: hypothetical protein A2729_00160 [Candidatus Buchananbacteria bacterium RIFCSPHIGHO2_01_FULL_39_14]|uniref:GMP synthase (glutamine-hydrolyzing) n=2 Tax=Candidatus Buchananiibacteriota TaxID=1817903 RepID=A0A1G1YMV5_9BACT|nr:MAG: hypothetical protein A2729_00160 [Candidatus Buchananbacteria bacterium RIFCSPHIGHO2_01_FULL_39_14]OGY48574.1 MAG: hypothetical protein A3D39_05565 [Candidatus Buchananbacteria bacterium RIFCSPHIGHO2_02_FULL_39_17]OGY53693.1 MAG: hypothetical protein A2912_05110 [Candidatus Buchananbacteria bacterium RIFCSPLOWO2_01_FULL_40_23b]